MWIFMRDAFLSVVEHDSEPKLLHVRARIRGDIERLFPEADVAETVEGDYRFRTSLPRERVAQVVALQISKINYTNFKGSVPDGERQQAYISVWSSMYDEQQRRYGPPPADQDEVETPAPRYVLDDPRFNLNPPTEAVEILEEAPVEAEPAETA